MTKSHGEPTATSETQSSIPKGTISATKPGHPIEALQRVVGNRIVGAFLHRVSPYGLSGTRSVEADEESADRFATESCGTPSITGEGTGHIDKPPSDLGAHHAPGPGEALDSATRA